VTPAALCEDYLLSFPASLAALREVLSFAFCSFLCVHLRNIQIKAFDLTVYVYCVRFHFNSHISVHRHPLVIS
jgi:hypothetical protein